MHRLLRPTGVALGLLSAVLAATSCADMSPTQRTTSLVSDPSVHAANVSGTSIVISQVYGGGGNSGATLKNDFIELFNRGSTTVDMTEYSVQYAAATGTSWQITNLTGMLAPGHYYLVQEAAQGGGTVSLPTPDAIGTGGGIPMAAGSGKVALMHQTSLIASGTSCPSTNLTDIVGYGTTADCGGRTATLSAILAAIRKDSGCRWSGIPASNVTNGDLEVLAPNPRNTASPTRLCAGVNVSPSSASVTHPGSQTFTATATDAAGNPISSTFTWSSSNTAVATINSSGVATTVGQGTATISALSGANGQTGTATITVVVPIASITITPASASIYKYGSQQFTASAFGANNEPISNPTVSWSTSDALTASVDGTGLAKALQPGDVTIRATAPNGVFKEASLHIDPPPPPPPVRFSELHYDNGGTDVNEAIEVEGPGGTDLTGWSIVLYDGNGGASYNTVALSGTITARCDGRGVVVVSPGQIQNGSPDGMALVDALGHVIEFLSYEGTFAATNGAAAGMPSSDIGVSEPGTTSANWSLQRNTEGIWEGPKPATFALCNTEPAPPAANTFSFSGRNPPDAPSQPDPALPVGFEDQLFATEKDGGGATIATNVTWSSDTPDIATIDSRGVFHARTVGTAILRATATDGTTATYSLPTADPEPSTSAVWGGNTEFGQPVGPTDFLIERDQFTASFSRSRNTPNWVSAKLEASHFSSAGGVDRCDCFTYDPLLPTDPTKPGSFTPITTGDYTGAGTFAGYGIDRGHLLRSFDVTASDGDNKFSYLFSNIIPQAHLLNTGAWANEENYLGDLARHGSDVYMIAGVAGNKGSVKGENKIIIPAQVWKVAVIMPHGKGLADVHSAADVNVIAVLMPNDADASSDWTTYKTTVDAVEAASGYDLLAALPDQIEIAIESDTHPPVAAVSGPYTGAEGSAITMSAAGSVDPDPGQQLSYSWNFGDGLNATGVSPSHVYARDGSYSITLTVTDPLGLVSTATTSATIANVAPVANPAGDASIVAHNRFASTISFTDPGDDMWQATVDYGDGSAPASFSVSTRVVPLSHMYAASGVYTIHVTISDGVDQTQASQLVHVYSPPVAALNGPYASSEGSSVSMSAAASTDPDNDIVSYVWNFGDGATGTGPTVAHTYADNGSFTVTLTVTDNYGLVDVKTTTASVANLPPSASFTAPAPISEGSSFTLSLTGATDPSSVDAAALTYAFDCGNGYSAPSSSSIVNCATTDNGQRSVRAKVIDKDGSFAEYDGIVQITNVAPTALFSAPVSVSEGDAIPLAVSNIFDPSSADANASFGIAFDCGSGFVAAASLTSATCSTDNNGVRTVRVRITDKDDGATEYSRDVTILNVAPTIAALAGATLLPGETYSAASSFTDPGSDVWTATVNYGDGSGTNALALAGKTFSLSHTYQSAGSFAVTVDVKDGSTTSTQSAAVVVLTPLSVVQSVMQQVDELPSAPGNSLHAKLDAAAKQIQAGKNAPAANQLEAFLNELDAMVRSGRMSAPEAEPLQTAVNRVIRSITR